MQHGGDLTEAMARHGAGGPPWLDLSTGINPHAWPVPDRLRRLGWERLPGRGELDALLAGARRAYRVPAAAGVVAAPGTQALIQWLPRLLRGGPVAVLGPTYSEHAAAWRSAGADVREVGALGEAGDARHLVVVNPNNPDGRVLTGAELREAAERCARRGGTLVIDESFADLDPSVSAVALGADSPVVVLRSFGKFYGLAGLRLGFAIAPPALADRVAAALGPWSVSGPALAVGTAALADTEWAEAMRVRLAREARALDRTLVEGRLRLLGGTSLYRLVRCGEATALHAALAAAHIWCRRFTDRPDLLRFGLPPDETGLSRVAAVLARSAHDQGTSTGSPANSAR